jgi:hypothetical protein
MYLIASLTVLIGVAYLTQAELTGEERDIAHEALYLANDDHVEGDMKVSPSQKAALKNRNAIANNAQRWPGGVVPYYVDPSLAQISGLIQQAAAQIATKTNNCIRFVPRTNQQKYVRMFFGNGCYSYVGVTGAGAQDLSLGRGCAYIGTVVHEMLHAVGFDHEQNRPDRDQFIYVNTTNILPGQEHNFNLRKDGRVWSSFDYNSVMLYGEKAFSKNGQATMIDRQGKYRLTEPYDKAGLSNDDVFEIKKLYGCA